MRPEPSHKREDWRVRSVYHYSYYYYFSSSSFSPIFFLIHFYNKKSERANNVWLKFNFLFQVITWPRHKQDVILATEPIPLVKSNPFTARLHFNVKNDSIINSFHLEISHCGASRAPGGARGASLWLTSRWKLQRSVIMTKECGILVRI